MSTSGTATSQIQTQIWKSPVGELLIGALNGKLCICDWYYRKMRKTIDSRIQQQLNAEYITNSHPVIDQTISELEEYFSGSRKDFEIPIALAGSEFQTSVWKALVKVPYGKTESYLGLSKLLGNEKAIRAVASANGANAISIIIPCHRIIGSGGELTGYAGGIPAKKKLLELEGSVLHQLELF